MKLLLILLLPCSIFAKDIVIDIKGLVCSTCAIGIKKNLIKTKKIKTISLNTQKQQASIEMIKNKQLTDFEIIHAIKNAGYEITKSNIKRSKNEQ